MHHQTVAIYATEILSAAGAGVSQTLDLMNKGICPASVMKGSLIPRRNQDLPIYSIARHIIDQQDMPKRIARMDRVSRLAFEVCHSLNPLMSVIQESSDSHRIGLWFGSSRGPVEKQMEASDSYQRGKVKPSLAVDVPIAATSGMLSGHLGITGPNITVSATCCSGGHALAEACFAISSGRCDFAVVVASEAAVYPSVLAQMQSAGMLTDEGDSPAAGCIPFSQSRSGTALGEGAAMILIANPSIAQSIPSMPQPLATIEGWDVATDSHSRTLSDHDGVSLQSSINRALKMAGINFSDISLISPHGTGTLYNDKVEAICFQRLQEAFPNTSPQLIPTKHFTGHCLGATSLMEVVIMVALLQNGPHPSLDYLHDPILPEDFFSPSQPTQQSHSNSAPCALSHSLGFWGNLFSAVIRKC